MSILRLVRNFALLAVLALAARAAGPCRLCKRGWDFLVIFSFDLQSTDISTLYSPVGMITQQIT
jgi:hypothetical protein